MDYPDFNGLVYCFLMHRGISIIFVAEGVRITLRSEMMTQIECCSKLVHRDIHIRVLVKSSNRRASRLGGGPIGLRPAVHARELRVPPISWLGRSQENHNLQIRRPVSNACMQGFQPWKVRYSCASIWAVTGTPRATWWLRSITSGP